MRSARSIIFFLVLVFATFALTASTALADPVQVSDEDGVPCEGLVGGSNPSGGCETQATGSITVVRHVFGIESTVANCNIATDVNIDEEGDGYLSNVSLTGGSCASLAPCDDAMSVDIPWSFGTEDRGNGTYDFPVALCVEHTNGTCQGSLDLVLNAPETEVEVTDDTVVSGCESTTDMTIADAGAFDVAEVSVLSETGAPAAVVLYSGALHAPDVADVTIGGYTCDILMHMTADSGVAGPTEVDAFTAFFVNNCNGAISGLQVGQWKARFDHEVMRTAMRWRIRVHNGFPIGDCDYYGWIKGALTNPTAVFLFRIAFSGGTATLPYVAGSVTCPSSIGVAGTFNVTRVDGGPGTNVWLRPF